jgi:dipeptidyl aminopeptidase/acylaminoacyl peptidase
MTETEQETLEETTVARADAIATEEPTETAEPIAEPLPPITAPVQPGAANPSPDGAQIAYFLPNEAGTLSLWILPHENGSARELATKFALVDDPAGPQWSPDGSQIAVTGLDATTGRTAIWLIDVNSGDAMRPLARPAADHSPRWSPDGSLLAFISRRNGRDAVNVVAPDGSTIAIQLTDAPRGHDEHDLVWSPNGARIAFCRWSPEVGELAGGDHIWTVDIATGEAKQLTKKLARRRSLSWGPARPLIAHVADDGEWENIAVVNADNSAGWTVASEPGDKDDPRWSADGARVLYTRRHNGVIRCCDKATSAASANLLDPGDGVVSTPRWLPQTVEALRADQTVPEAEVQPEDEDQTDAEAQVESEPQLDSEDEPKAEAQADAKSPKAPQHVVYAYAAIGQPFRFIVQENKTETERTELSISDWTATRTLIKPNWSDFKTANGTKLSGHFYFPKEIAGWAPGILYLGDRPERARTLRFRASEQVLVGSGFAVFAPSLPGTPGLGRKVINALAAQLDGESEISDLVDALDALKNMPSVDSNRLAVVGEGYGATLALLLAGGRPGLVSAVAAVDPITDWELELDEADDAWRAWILKNYGLPAANLGRFALRTPETFAGVIDAPLLLIGTDRVPAHRALQRETLAATVRELGVDVQEETVTGQTEWETATRIAEFVRTTVKSLKPGRPLTTEAVNPETV